MFIFRRQTQYLEDYFKKNSDLPHCCCWKNGKLREHSGSVIVWVWQPRAFSHKFLMGYWWNLQNYYLAALQNTTGGEMTFHLAKLILTCILSCKNWIASLCLMQDTACLELVHGDDPERCYGEGRGRGVHVWERM